MSTEIIIRENVLNTLQSKEMKKELGKILKAMEKMNRGQWEYAVSVNNIVVNRLYEDEDCKNLKEFCEKKLDDGKTYGVWLKAYKSVQFIICETAKAYGLTMENTSMSNAYIFFTVYDKGSKEWEKFVIALDGVLIGRTKAELENAIKSLKEDDKKVVNTESTEENEEKAESDEIQKKNNVECYVNDGVMYITYRKKNYQITLKDLKQYITE